VALISTWQWKEPLNSVGNSPTNPNPNPVWQGGQTESFQNVGGANLTYTIELMLTFWEGGKAPPGPPSLNAALPGLVYLSSLISICGWHVKALTPALAQLQNGCI